MPLLNTVILLSSRVSVTCAHHRLIRGNHSQTMSFLGLTILGAYFTVLQGVEYYKATFTFCFMAFKKSLVRLPAPDTDWTFFHIT